MKKILFLLFLLIPNISFAKIYIVIDEASARKFPIGLPPLITEDGQETALTREITSLLKQDLDLAGYFKVIGEQSLLTPDRDTTNIDFSKWTQLEAFALVKGIITGKSGGKITLELRLYDTQIQKLLVGKQYVVSQGNYPEAIHRFMDDLMLALTGLSGPFSTRVAAACGPSNGRQIYTMAIDGTQRSQVTRNKSNNISPSWSPDGGQIAYTSFLNYFPEVFVTDLSGKARQLTRLQSTSITPVFSPDGSHIVYASSKSGDMELYSVGSAGGPSTQLTHMVNIDVSPTFSPDGSQLVFSSERAGNLHLFAMGSGGGGANRLTYTGYQNDQPDISPDGKKIAFTSRDRGAFDIFMMNSDGSLIQRITRDEGNNESPSWSPDNRYLLFSSARAGGRGLYVMMADGNNQTIIPSSAGCINPEWGPK